MLYIDWKTLDVLWATRPEVLAAWAFGSARNGLVREDGDVDLGVLFGSRPSLDALADISASVQHLLSVEAVDLVVLNDASPILQFEVVSGLLLYCRDLYQCAGFVSLVARQYEDEMAMLERWTIRRFQALDAGSQNRKQMSTD